MSTKDANVIKYTMDYEFPGHHQKIIKEMMQNAIDDKTRPFFNRQHYISY